MIDTTVFQNKKAVYYTLGCKLNFSETSTIGKILKEAGVRTARKGEVADICIVIGGILFVICFCFLDEKKKPIRDDIKVKDENDKA